MKFKILKTLIFHKTGITLSMNPFEKTSTTEASGLARSVIVSPDPLTTKHIVSSAICSSITSVTLFTSNSLYKHIVLAFMYIFLVKRTSVTDATQMVILKSKKESNFSNAFG